jgi:hypothetical protein
MRGVDVQESGGAFAVSACHCAVSDTGHKRNSALDEAGSIGQPSLYSGQRHAPDCAGKWLRATKCVPASLSLPQHTTYFAAYVYM